MPSVACESCGERPVISTAVPMPGDYQFVYGPKLAEKYGAGTYGVALFQPKFDLPIGAAARLVRQWSKNEASPVCSICGFLTVCGCCECAQCGGCDTPMVEGGECRKCGYCAECCSCTECGGCGAMHDEYASWCENCEYIIGCCCECAHCDNCGDTTNACNIHYACGMGDSDACGCCSCYSSDYEDECDCSTCSGGAGGFGTTTEVEWHDKAAAAVARSQGRERDGAAFWGFDPSSFDPARAMCDYFLLQAVRTVALPMGWDRPYFGISPRDRIAAFYSAEADDMLKVLVKEADANFMAYADMAIGGELRYHRAVKRAMRNPGDRNDAWAAWKEIRADIGSVALAQAADLFEEIDNGSYGGVKWAMAARLLHKRVTGVVKPTDFVNLVFALQHNGGSFLNKVNWRRDNPAGFDLDSMKSVIGPAHSGDHGGTAWSVLMLGASEDVRGLFAEAWKYGNELRPAMGEKRTAVPSHWDCVKRNGTRRDGSVTLPDGSSVWYVRDFFPELPAEFLSYKGEVETDAPLPCKYGIPGCPGH